MRKLLLQMPRLMRHCEEMKGFKQSYSRPVPIISESNPQNEFTLIGRLLRADSWLRARQSALAMTAAFIVISLFYSCTTDITVDLPDPKEQIVIEGYIEQDEAPYVLLTKNSPFFGGFDLNDVEQYIVHDAIVTVSDGIVTDTLDEQCFTIAAGDSVYTVCIYLAENPALKGELNKTYHLRVEAEGKVLTASAVIPDLLALDSLYYEPHEDPDVDSLVQIVATVSDPDTIGNYVRFFTQRNSETMYPAFAFDDRFINGQTFSIPIQRAEDPDADYDPDTYGYFWKGDTVIVKWTAISKATYDFWNTLDYETNSGGPFGSATVIKSNVTGGLGIWGGYAAFYDTLYISQ